MKKYVASLSFLLASVHAGAAQFDPVQHPVTEHACSYAESFVINAYSNINKSNIDPYYNISSNINNTTNLEMRVGARVANNFISTQQIWAPQYAQWAMQNIRPWCRKHIGYNI